MATIYKCSRCGIYETTKFCDIKRHIFRKNSCKKDNKYIFLSDDQILSLSLLPFSHNNNYENEIQHLENSNILDKNKEELFKELELIEKNKIKTCKLCKNEFNFISDLKKHLIINCFYNDLQKKENDKINLLNDTTSTIDNTTINYNNNNNNSNNNNNNTTINGNINIYLDMKTPIPFDQYWDVSKISIEKKSDIIISQVMYTELLESIFENDLNLNVIIDNEKKSGMVYKNDIDKYICMKSKDIVANTMEKLNYHLIELNKENANNNRSLKEVIDFTRKIINKKYIDFQKNTNIQNGVEKCICNIYENKKKEAINMAKNIPNIDMTGY